VGEVRTVGLTAAVALRPDLLAADPALPDKVAAASIHHGVATRSLRGHAIQLSPAFVVSEAELDAMVDGFARALEEVAEH
jgi:adenosylmethionine-8-amino-7-oxononanoate aminotransferase